MLQEIKIAMLGPRGVGKTSLLTAMYEQFDSTIGKTDLQLTPDLESSALLQKRLGELKSLLDDFEAKGGVGTTIHPRSFIFDLGKKGGKPFVRLHFRDFPGEYFNTNASIEQKQFVKDLLTESDAVLIAIDTPALMEDKGKWHDAINKPRQIQDFFQAVYQDMKSPRLVIFAPVKCEKYMQDLKSATTLLKRVQEKYANLLNLFSSDALLPWIVSVVSPVQTVGSVVFSNVKIIDGEPHFYFRKINHDAKYSPQDSEQPLLYLLRFILKVQLEKRNWHWGPFSRIRVRLGWDEHLKEAARKATKECESSWGFKVLQGEKWLNIG